MIQATKLRFDNMTRTWFAALVLAVASVVSLPVHAGEDEAKQSLQSARELYAAGNWDTAREAYEKAFEQAPEESILRAEAALELGSLLWEQGRYAPAEKHVRDAMKRAKALGLDQAVGRLLLTLGHIEASTGRLGDAEGTLEVCVKSAKEQHDANSAALCRINLRFVRQLRGRSVGSEKRYRANLKTLMDSGQDVLVGTALAKSAELQEKAGDHAGALATLKRAQAKFEAAGSVPARKRNRLRLAQAHQNLGDWASAAKAIDGLVLDLRNMNNRPALVTAYALRGKQRAHDGKAGAAVNDLNAALDLAKELKSPQIVANVQLGLCEFYASANQPDPAGRHCQAAARGFGRVGAPSLAARSYILLARLGQAREEWLQARNHYLEAMKILEGVAKSARDEREIAVQKVNLCQVEMKLKANGAQQRCLEAREALGGVSANDASFRGMVAATEYAIGTTASDERRKQAIAALEKAAQTWRELRQFPQAADALLRQGKLETSEGKTQQARKAFAEGLELLGDELPAAQTTLATQLGILLAQVELDVERWSEARETLRALIDRATGVNDHYSAAWGYSALARAELKLGNRDDAIAALEKGSPHARKADDEELAKMIDANLTKLRKKP